VAHYLRYRSLLRARSCRSPQIPQRPLSGKLKSVGRPAPAGTRDFPQRALGPGPARHPCRQIADLLARSGLGIPSSCRRKRRHSEPLSSPSVAGVSTATVPRAYAPSTYVANQARDRIPEVANSLGYSVIISPPPGEKCGLGCFSEDRFHSRKLIDGKMTE
jgi:hypothetical protein